MQEIRAIFLRADECYRKGVQMEAVCLFYLEAFSFLRTSLLLIFHFNQMYIFLNTTLQMFVSEYCWLIKKMKQKRIFLFFFFLNKS